MQNDDKFKEGRVAKSIEKKTAKIPSDVYLWAAVGSMAVSLGCFLAKKKHTALFFGQWAPSLLTIGLYNKLVKLQGHDQEDGKENKENNQATSNANAESLVNQF